MLRSSKRTARRRSFWIIVKYQKNGPMEVLTVDYRGEEALPVFSFEEESLVFLSLKVPGEGWRARETTAGELVSLLYGLCASVKKVALDPPSFTSDGDEIADLVSVDWRRFVRDLVDGCAPGFPSMDPEETYVPDYVMWDFGCPKPSGDSGEDEPEVAVWSPREGRFDL